MQRLDPRRLYTERMLIKKDRGFDVITNYCIIITPDRWGDKYSFFEHRLGSISDFFITIQSRTYHYFECDPFFVPPFAETITGSRSSSGQTLKMLVLKKPFFNILAWWIPTEIHTRLNNNVDSLKFSLSRPK